jgi:NAD(P)-dependent dehydrogenase (short-subunit alcohol dehydrogenase family)
MSRIFITGSSDGLGQLAARELIAQGNRVVLHARNDIRALQAINAVAGALTIIT